MEVNRAPPSIQKGTEHVPKDQTGQVSTVPAPQPGQSYLQGFPDWWGLGETHLKVTVTGPRN